jgi:hypothetical protein
MRNSLLHITSHLAIDGMDMRETISLVVNDLEMVQLIDCPSSQVDQQSFTS